MASVLEELTIPERLFLLIAQRELTATSGTNEPDTDAAPRRGTTKNPPL